MDDNSQSLSKKCPFKKETKYNKPNERSRYFCHRPVHQDHGFCVFHSKKVEEKRKAFLTALTGYIENVEGNEEQKTYEFIGFIFPEIHFHNIIFKKDADFRESQFSGFADFSGSKFLGLADFRESQFAGNVTFRDSQFAGKVTFTRCDFASKTNFINCQFSGTIDFTNNQLHGNTDFRMSKYLRYANFCDNKFYRYTNFGESQFIGNSDFSRNQFSMTTCFMKIKFFQRFECSQAVFHNEVFFSNTHFAYLKNVGGGETTGMHWEGAVLQEASLWGIKELTNHSFRDAFLLSISLAGKRLVNCDFTGAVFDAVHTRGWEPDPATLDNTKYIYTDYTVEPDPDNPERTLYTPVLESRVPGDGEFGVGPNAGFTLKEFLKQPFVWSITPNIPLHLRTAVGNYFRFFADYVRVTEGIPVDIATHAEGQRIRVEFRCETATDKEHIKPWFEKYLLLLKQKPEDIRPENHNPAATADEREMMIIDLRHQVSTLQTKISYTERLLQKEEEKNQILMFKNDPASMMPAKALTYSAQVFFLNADIEGFQAASQQDGEIHKTLPAFLIDQTRPTPHDVAPSKREGDCIKLFWKDGVELCFAADQLRDALKPLRRKHPAIKGMRIVLGSGLCDRTEKNGMVEVAGDPITETCRVDPLMKAWLKGNQKDPNQIWCTEAFKIAIDGKDSRITFEEISERFDLKNKHASPGTGPDRLYRVTITL